MFNRVNPTGWGILKKLSSAMLNQLDINLSRALDGLNGGTYSLASLLRLSGAEVEIQHLNIPSTGDLITDAESTATFNGVATFNDQVAFNDLVVFEQGVTHNEYVGFTQPTYFEYAPTLGTGSCTIDVPLKLLNGSDTTYNVVFNGTGSLTFRVNALCNAGVAPRAFFEIPTPPPGAQKITSIKVSSYMSLSWTGTITAVGTVRLIEINDLGQISNSWSFDDTRSDVIGNYTTTPVNATYTITGGATLSSTKKYAIEVVAPSCNSSFYYHWSRIQVVCDRTAL